MECSTHLTVNYHRSVKNNEIDDYRYEGCMASKGINLRITENSALRPPKSIRKTEGYGPRNSTHEGDALG